MPALRVAVLASGRGTNLQALIDARAAGALDIELVGVFGDRPGAAALARARGAGIATEGFPPARFADRSAYEDALFAALDRVHPQLIVCAGYMRLISARHVRRHLGRMINIHPSLLPDYRGLRTHERALADGVRTHGASLHFVTPELDGGPVFAQARIDVRDGDDATTLATRVLEIEHPLLVAGVDLFARGRIGLDGDAVRVDGRSLRQPLQLDADGRLAA